MNPLILALLLTACTPCQTYYRFDGRSYYRVDECLGKAPQIGRAHV